MEGPSITGGAVTGRTYDAVLLDLFGTLVDFGSVFTVTLERVLLDHDLVHLASAFEEKWRRFTFQGIDDGEFITVREDFQRSLEAVLAELGREGDLTVYTDRVIDDMFRQLRGAALFPEVPRVLEALEEAGVAWAIVSNVDEDDLQAIMAHHRLQPSTTVSSERAESYKPAPGVFEMALREMDMGAGRVVHVGDSPLADVSGALSVGIDVAWVNRYGATYPEGLPRPGWEIPDLSPLPRLVLER